VAWGRRLGRGRASARAAGRRSGPVGESPWWDPADQAFAEAPVVSAASLGRGWRSVPMMNNVERLDALGSDADSAAIRVLADGRVRTALDEGQALRRHHDGALVVVRVEVYRDAERVDEHRAAWRAHGVGALDALWRERWRERDVAPGWIEASWRSVDERPEELHAFREQVDPPGPAGTVDWFRVEDHTDPSGAGTVTEYQYVLAWAGRVLTTVTVRHELGADGAEVAAAVALAALERPSPPA
jgi:hypothetical protein